MVVSKSRVKQLELEREGQATIFDYGALGEFGRELVKRDELAAANLKQANNHFADFGEHVLKHLPKISENGVGREWLQGRFNCSVQYAYKCVRAFQLRRDNPRIFDQCISIEEVVRLAPSLPKELLIQPAPDPVEPPPLADNIPPESRLPLGPYEKPVWTPNDSGTLGEENVYTILKHFGIPHETQKRLPLFDKLGRSPKRVDAIIYHPDYPDGLILEVKASRSKKPNIPEKIVFDIESIQEHYTIPGIVICDGDALEDDPNNPDERNVLGQWAYKYYTEHREKAEKSHGAHPLRFLGMMPLSRFEQWTMQLSKSL
jgi:hypothetical protein